MRMRRLSLGLMVLTVAVCVVRHFGCVVCDLAFSEQCAPETVLYGREREKERERQKPSVWKWLDE